MEPREPTDEEVEAWAIHDNDTTTARRVLGGPEEGSDVIPCPTVVSFDAGLCRVAYQLDEIELAHLARGGTLWLTTWGLLPVHLLSVSEAGDNSRDRSGENGRGDES